MSKEIPTNQEIAGVLERIADLLEVQGENEFRVRSYRDGAATLRQANESVAKMVHEERLDDLKKLPKIGTGLASVIEEYVSDRESDLLNRLETETDPVNAFSQLPGMDAERARRVVDELEIKTLEELEQSIYNGRLERLEGFDEQRLRTLRTALAGMLSGAAQNRIENKQAEAAGKQELKRPGVELLLEVDAEYRKKAEAGQLKTIAPKRFNPDNEAWLPVFNVKREGWEFTALFSNTAQAHKLGKTREWVVIYYEREGYESQATVVTGSGELEGKRVVRGREMETQQYYQTQKEKET